MFSPDLESWIRLERRAKEGEGVEVAPRRVDDFFSLSRTQEHSLCKARKGNESLRESTSVKLKKINVGTAAVATRRTRSQRDPTGPSSSSTKSNSKGGSEYSSMRSGS